MKRKAAIAASLLAFFVVGYGFMAVGNYNPAAPVQSVNGQIGRVIVDALSALGLTSARGLDHEIVIAIRSDTKCSSDGIIGCLGDSSDPFDGRKYDNIFTAYYNAGWTNVHFVIKPGVFTSRGNQGGWTAQPQWKIRGSGKDATTIKFDPTFSPTAGQQCFLILSDYNKDGNGIEVSDLTLDCNSQNVTGATANGENNFKVSGAMLYGNYSGYVRVRVKNAYGSWANGLEVFDLGQQSYTLISTEQPPIGGYALDCIAESPQGTYQTGIAIGLTASRSVLGMGNVIDHGTANGYKKSGTNEGMTGLSANSIVNSTANDCNVGMRWEQAPDIKIVNDTIRNCHRRAISIEDSAGANNVLISGNSIELRKDDPANQDYGVLLNNTGGADTNVSVVNNTITFINTGTNTVYGIITGSGTANGYSFVNNHEQTGMSNIVPADSNVLLNRSLTGGILSDLQDNVAFSNAPVLLKAPNITILTAGTPSDIATIKVPFARWRIAGGTSISGVSNGVIYAETAAGTLAGASVSGWTTTGGGGTQMMGSQALPASASTDVVWYSQSATNVSTSSTLVIRQTANSANAGTATFYVPIQALP